MRECCGSVAGVLRIELQFTRYSGGAIVFFRTPFTRLWDGSNRAPAVSQQWELPLPIKQRRQTALFLALPPSAQSHKQYQYGQELRYTKFFTFPNTKPSRSQQLLVRFPFPLRPHRCPISPTRKDCHAVPLQCPKTLSHCHVPRTRRSPRMGFRKWPVLPLFKGDELNLVQSVESLISS